MYNELYGLRKDPFRVSPDPSFLFLTDQHREALSGLTYAILQRSGFVVLTGEIGTGKTTLLARILRFLPANRLQFSKIVNPILTPAEFFELVLLEFGLRDIPTNKAQRLWMLQNLVAEGRREGKVSVLIVDEAQNLTPEVLEEIRMLGNYEEAELPCLQVLLVGQTELDDTLNRDDLRQLKQRISARFTLGPLAPTEVGDYMRHRWMSAGGKEMPFTPEAIADVAYISRRIPRVINALCDNALLVAFAGRSTTVLHTHVREAAEKLDLGEAPGATEPDESETASELKPELQPPLQVLTHKPSLWNRWVSRHESA
ncbi:MAG TPA: AAA family ATPase [Verrucomicrobiae bacterium]|nr:AAA family ATPase [Verrucomicrobiae bacterium]